MAQETPAPQTPAAQTTTHALPWWKNQLFWGMVGGAVVSAADRGLHLGIPTAAPVGVTVGLAIAWGAHTVLLDWAAHSHSAAASDVERWVTAFMPTLEAVLTKIEGSSGKGA